VVSPSVLLYYLPPYRRNKELIKEDQYVRDIIKEVLDAHEIYAQDYDAICSFFDGESTEQICRQLFDFCKGFVQYRIEDKEEQTTQSPSGIIVLGHGDCKHYASFIGGCLDALKRKGKKIDWWYRFASYNWLDDTPQHVFVVVKDKGKEIWIDPVLRQFNERYMPKHTPVDYQINVHDMALYRVSGIGLPADYKGYIPQGMPQQRMLLAEDDAVAIADNYIDQQITPDLEDKIKMMLYYGLLNEDGQFNEAQLEVLAQQLPESDFNEILDGYGEVLNQATISGLFSDIWRGVKKVTLAVPRGAYLALVSLNIFGLGTKLWKAAFNTDGSYYQPGQQKVRDRWYSLGGDWSNLESAIKKGHTKPKVLGNSMETVYYRIGELNQVGAAPAAIAAAAVTIIAALAPIVKSILEQRKAQGFDINPDDLDLPTPPSATEQLQKYLPYILLAGAVVYFLASKKRK
jgi:hypothetical protein